MNAIPAPMMSADTAELLAFIIGVISFVGIVVGLIAWRKDGRWMRWSWLGAVVALLFARGVFQWDAWEWFTLLFLAAWATGILCFTVMRRRALGFSSAASWVGALAGSVIPVPLLLLCAAVLNDRTPVRDNGPWFIFFVPVALLGVVIVVGAAYLARLYGSKAVPCADEAETPAREQDRQMVLNMLRDGKVSGEQAADLLKALGPKPHAADKLPLTRSVIGAVGGAILIVVGFMLPWSYVRIQTHIFGRMEGYQAGYNVGYVGWIVLIAGILPAIFVCIPSLDKHLRQGLSRLVIACIGGAFVVVMLLRSPQGVGLWVAAVGFAVQLFTAFRQAGLAGPSGQTR